MTIILIKYKKKLHFICTDRVNPPLILPKYPNISLKKPTSQRVRLHQTLLSLNHSLHMYNIISYIHTKKVKYVRIGRKGTTVRSELNVFSEGTPTVDYPCPRQPGDGSRGPRPGKIRQP